VIVTFTDRARSDLIDIAEWIGFDNPGRAATFAMELRERCLSLSSLPARFPVAYEASDHSVRKMTHGQYLIFYAILPQRVDILRIVHSSRDWASLFDG
jgi:toxin ParE1/3/4